MNKKVSPHLFSAIAVYVILTFLQPLLNLVVLQPLFLNNFSTDEYGIIGLMSSFTSFIGIVGALGLGNTFFVFYYDYNQKKGGVSYFLGQILSFSVYAAVAYLLLFAVLGTPLFQQVLFSGENIVPFFPYGWWALVAGIGYTFHNPHLALLRNEKKLKQYAIFALVITLIAIAGQSVAMYLDCSLNTIFFLRALAMFVGAVWVLVVHRSSLCWQINWRDLQPSFKFIRFSLPENILNWAYSYGDRFLIAFWLPLKVVGIYSLLTVLAGAVDMLYHSVRAALQPLAYEALQNSTSNKQGLKDMFDVYMYIVLLGVSGVIWVSAHIDWFTKQSDYFVLVEYMFFFAPFCLLGAMSYWQYGFFHFYKNTSLVFLITLVSLGVLVGLNVALLPIYGMGGAVVAYGVSRCVSALATVLYQRTRLYTGVTYKGLCQLIAIVGIIIGFGVLAHWEYISFKLAADCQFCVNLFGTAFFFFRYMRRNLIIENSNLP